MYLLMGQLACFFVHPDLEFKPGQAFARRLALLDMRGAAVAEASLRLLGVERAVFALDVAFLRAGLALPPKSESESADSSATSARRRLDTPPSDTFHSTAADSLRAPQQGLAPWSSLQKQGARFRACVLIGPARQSFPACPQVSQAHPEMALSHL